MLSNHLIVNKSRITQSALAYVGGAVYPFTRADIPAIAGNKKRDPCDDEADFTGDYCSKVNDTVNFVCGGADKQSVKMTKTDTGFDWCAIKRDWGSNFDLRDGTDPPHIRVRFYIHEGSGDSLWSKIHYLYFDVYAPDFANRFRDGLVFGPSAGRFGWFERIICPSHWATTGSPVWSTGRYFRFRIVTYNNSEVPAATLDQIEFLTRPAKARYLLTFDDNTTDQYEMAAYMTSKGIKGTFFVITSTVGGGGKLTLAQLNRMQDAGHLIANHTHTHKNWGSVSTLEMVQDITNATRWLCDNGFIRGSRIFALPYGSGSWKDDEKQAILGRHVDQVRLTDYGPLTENNKIVHNADASLIDTQDGDDPPKMTTRVATAITDKATIATYFHDFGAAPMTQANFETHIDSIAADRDAGDLDIITMVDLLRSP